MFSSHSRWAVLPITLLIMVLSASYITSVGAVPNQQEQPTPGASLVVDDVIQSINGTTWVVGGHTIIVTSQTITSGVPVIGKKAHLVVVADSNGHWIAQSVTIIIIIVPPTLTPTPSATLTPTPNITATPLAAMPTSTTSGGPTLALTPTNAASATSLPIHYVSIVIEGPVEMIDLNVDIIQVYGQRVKLKHDDPLRARLKVGDWLHINGNFGVDVDQQVVIIEVVLVIIDPQITIIIAPSSNGNSGDGGDDDGGKKKHKKD